MLSISSETVRLYIAIPAAVAIPIITAIVTIAIRKRKRDPPDDSGS